MQQQHITRQIDTALAIDPLRKFARGYWTFCAMVLGTFLLLSILSSFIPQPFRDEIFWSKTSDLTKQLGIVLQWLPLCFVAPLVGNTITAKKWKSFEQSRQETVENHFRGRTMVTYSLPEIFSDLPTTMTIQTRRNWRATWIAGTIYSFPLGFIFLTQVLDWQANIQYLIQQGEISGWVFLGSIPTLLLAFLPMLFILAVFLLAPRQRLIATQEGLMCYRYLRFSYIPWHEARLFAVVGERKNTIVYELASSSTVIRWASKPTALAMDTLPEAIMSVAPLGLIQAENATEEYQWQIRQIAAIVAQGTNLPLYDLRP